MCRSSFSRQLQQASASACMPSDKPAFDCVASVMKNKVQVYYTAPKAGGESATPPQYWVSCDVWACHYPVLEAVQSTHTTHSRQADM